MNYHENGIMDVHFDNERQCFPQNLSFQFGFETGVCCWSELFESERVFFFVIVVVVAMQWISGA